MCSDVIHLIAPAGSCRPFLEALELTSADELVTRVQRAVGKRLTVTGCASLIEAGEDEEHGGRQDDRQRARDINAALADDRVVAILALRGGAWFTRVLGRIDFSLIEARSRPVAVIGFSELTTLVNIVGAQRNGIGIYDMSPAFLPYGLKRLVRGGGAPDAEQTDPEVYARERLAGQFEFFLQDLADMLTGRGTARTIEARLVRGSLPEQCEAIFVGGNLVVYSTLVGSTFDGVARPKGRWLLLEEINEKPERIDRFLTHLSLAGYWDKCAGLLLGDFHREDRDLTPAVVELLDYHLPADRPMPVLATENVGHVWPMSPLPLHLPVGINRMEADKHTIQWSADMLRVIG